MDFIALWWYICFFLFIFSKKPCSTRPYLTIVQAFIPPFFLTHILRFWRNKSQLEISLPDKYVFFSMIRKTEGNSSAGDHTTNSYIPLFSLFRYSIIDKKQNFCYIYHILSNGEHYDWHTQIWRNNKSAKAYFRNASPAR